MESPGKVGESIRSITSFLKNKIQKIRKMSVSHPVNLNCFMKLSFIYGHVCTGSPYKMCTYFLLLEVKVVLVLLDSGCHPPRIEREAER
jgi:hypothetical protein